LKHHFCSCKEQTR